MSKDRYDPLLYSQQQLFVAKVLLEDGLSQPVQIQHLEQEGVGRHSCLLRHPGLECVLETWGSDTKICVADLTQHHHLTGKYRVSRFPQALTVTGCSEVRVSMLCAFQ